MRLHRHHETPSIWFFVLVALIIHSLFSEMKIPAPRLANTEKEDHAPIELAQVDEMDERAVVETSRAQTDSKDKEKAPFAGEFKNRTDKQMRAERSGKFREGRAGSSASSGPNRRGLGSAPPSTPSEGDLDLGDHAGSLAMSDLLPIPSTQPGVLPKDIEAGGQTILNTDPVVYASFINRVREELYSPWVSYVTQAAQNRELHGDRLNPNLYVTKLKVVLDGEGNVVSLQTVKSSGVKAIDEAPKKAFWDREPFPNPPFELSEDKKFIPIVFEFHFEYETSSFGIVPWRI